MDLVKNFSKKEKYYLIIFIVVVIFFIFYKFIFLPLDNKNKDLKFNIDNNIELLSWIKGRESTITLLRNAPQISSKNKNMSILTAVTETMSLNKIDKIKHDVSQIDPTSVNISFAAAPFDDIMKWITQLRKDYGITVKDLNALRDPIKPGVVKISFTLQREDVDTN